MSQEEVTEQKVQESKDEDVPIQQEEQLQQEEQQEPQQQNLNEEQFAFDDNAPIFIQVSDPIEKGTGMSKYVVYALKGRDSLGEFEIQRRFNEFYVLREILLAKWPGQYVPPIPEKQMSLNTEAINERVRLLNIFVMKMTQIKYLYYSEEFATIFLRSTQTDIAKQIQAIPKSNVQAQIYKYKNTFGITDIVEPPPETLQKMNSVQSFLRKSQTVLIKLFEQSKQLIASRKALKDQLISVVAVNFQEYERMVLLECVANNSKLIFTNPNAAEINQFLNAFKESSANPLNKIQDLITTEQRDLDAFLQAFQTRDQILIQKQKVEAKLRDEQEQLSNVMAGKATIKGTFSKLSLEEQKQKLELQMMETQKEVDSFKLFYQLVTSVLTQKQIDKFKKDKHESYKSIIKDLAKLEVEQNTQIMEFWTKLQSIIETASEQ